MGILCKLSVQDIMLKYLKLLLDRRILVREEVCTIKLSALIVIEEYGFPGVSNESNIVT